MKIKILILSSLLLLAFACINACSVNWNDPESQTVDQMFAGDEGNNSTLSGFPGSPQESKNLQVGQKGKEILSTPIAGKLTTVALSPQESRGQAQPQTNTTALVAPNTTEQAVPEAASTTTTSVSGSWSLDLNDGTRRAAALTLFQSGDAVFGTGNLRLDANNTLMATASGTITGDKLNLDLVTLERVNLYRLMLTVSGNSTDGSYSAYGPGKSPSSGTAHGLRSVPS